MRAIVFIGWAIIDLAALAAFAVFLLVSAGIYIGAIQ